MKTCIAIITLGLTLTAVAKEPLTPPLDTQQLVSFLEEAKNIATQKFGGNKTDLVHAYLTPFYGSRMSCMASGSLVSFTLRGSQRKEKLGEMEDRIIVIFQDGKAPEAKRIQVWLNQGILGATR